MRPHSSRLICHDLIAGRIPASTRKSSVAKSAMARRKSARCFGVRKSASGLGGFEAESLFHGISGEEGATIWVQHFAVGEQGVPGGISLPATPTRWSAVGQWEWPRLLMQRLSRRQKTPEPAKTDPAGELLLALLLEEFGSSGNLTKYQRTGSARTIHRVIDWIEHHPFPLPAVKDIAGFAGWSMSYLREQFRESSGRSLGEFLKQHRMEEAARLLVETRKPIKEIAIQAGYADVAAFTRAFLDRYKVAPGQYRNQRTLMV